MDINRRGFLSSITAAFVVAPFAPALLKALPLRNPVIDSVRSAMDGAAQSLFEYNDPYTRAQFRSYVSAYLRSLQSNRQIYDYLVVCDDTNNQPEEQKEFVADVYLKLNKVLDSYISINMVASHEKINYNDVIMAA